MRCDGTLKPRIHWCVARTKVIAVQLLMYPHVLEYGCCHCFSRRMDILFGVASASTHIILSTETMKEGELSELMEAIIQVLILFRLLRIVNTPLQCLLHIRLGFSVYDTHIVNTVSSFILGVVDYKFALLFRDLCYMLCWVWHVPWWLIRFPLRRTAIVYEGVVTHVRGHEILSGKVRDPVTELILTLHDEVSLFTVEVMTYL